VPVRVARFRMPTGTNMPSVIDQLDVAIGHHHIAVLNVGRRDTPRSRKRANVDKIGTRFSSGAPIGEILSHQTPGYRPPSNPSATIGNHPLADR